MPTEKKWNIDMSYGFNASVTVTAASQEEAIRKAQAMVDEHVSIINTAEYEIDTGNIEYDQVTFVKQA